MADFASAAWGAAPALWNNTRDHYAEYYQSHGVDPSTLRQTFAPTSAENMFANQAGEALSRINFGQTRHNIEFMDPTASMQGAQNAVRSDDELRGLYDFTMQALGTGNNQAQQAGLTDSFTRLMENRQSAAKSANDAYQMTQLGGNYAGGVLPEGGYRDTMRMGGLGSLGGFNPNEQNTGWNAQPQQAPQTTQNATGGLGGLGGWGGPFSNKNPWGAS